jgi:hypothetical protein
MSEQYTSHKAKRRPKSKTAKARDLQRTASKAAREARKAARAALEAQRRVEKEKQRNEKRAARKAEKAHEAMERAAYSLIGCLGPGEKTERHLQGTARKAARAYHFIGLWLTAEMDRQRKRAERKLARAATGWLERSVQVQRPKRWRQASLTDFERNGGAYV